MRPRKQINSFSLRLVKGIYWDLILDSQNNKLKEFPLKTGTRQTCSLLPRLFNTVLETLARAIRQKKERDTNRKRRAQTISVCQ
uniref:Reverse transcriptase domain-containing protein n=1 Tax=Spermophilus dauricus TaxID=99837 RepID=A0A8C9UNR4_SPEDA